LASLGIYHYDNYDNLKTTKAILVESTSHSEASATVLAEALLILDWSPLEITVDDKELYRMLSTGGEYNRLQAIVNRRAGKLNRLDYIVKWEALTLDKLLGGSNGC